MSNLRDDLINRVIAQPDKLPTLTTCYGLILKYNAKVWQNDLWQAHVKTHSSNALLFSFLKKKAQKIFRSQSKLHALFTDKDTAVNTACAIHLSVVKRKIPLSMVLYTGQGVLKEDVWLCNTQYLAESLLGPKIDQSMLLHHSFALNYLPPEGVGFFPASSAEHQWAQQEFFYLKDYRSYNPQEEHDNQSD